MTRRLIVLAVAVTLIFPACGDDGDADEATGDGSTTTGVVTTDTAGTDGPTSTGATTPEGTATTESGAGSTTSAPGAEDLPGEPIDIHPYEGALLAVVGVAADDTLNVRSGPGTSFDVVVELAPLDDGFTATGRNRTLDDGSFWSEVVAEGVTGWANGAYLAQLGTRRDISGDVTAPVEEPDTASAALAVAGDLYPTPEGGPVPDVTLVGESATEATVDVIGLGDDAQKGVRLHVSGIGPDLVVESVALCARGVTDGLCV